MSYFSEAPSHLFGFISYSAVLENLYPNLLKSFFLNHLGPDLRTQNRPMRQPGPFRSPVVADRTHLSEPFPPKSPPYALPSSDHRRSSADSGSAPRQGPLSSSPWAAPTTLLPAPAILERRRHLHTPGHGAPCCCHCIDTAAGRCSSRALVDKAGRAIVVVVCRAVSRAV
jgi:hypothetical protein